MSDLNKIERGWQEMRAGSALVASPILRAGAPVKDRRRLSLLDT